MISMLLFVRPALDAVASTRISCTPRKRGWLAVLCAFLAVLLCVAGNVASAQTAAGNFGNINIGTTSPVISLVLTFATSDTLASTSVLTQGAVGLDFSDAGSDTCTANTAYTAGQTCTVNVTFTPRFAGTRLGAVILQDNSGNIIAIGRLQGTGVGPQVIFQPGIQSTLGSGLSSPEGVAVDGNGNIYFTEVNGSVLHEMLAVNGTLPASPVMRTIGSGLGSITFWALDGAGNLYVADYENNAVKEILAVNGSIPASPTIKTLGSGFSDPAGVAVDGNGNVFVTGLADNTVKEIVAVNGSVPASPVIRTLASSFHEPIGIAVDASGNVYVADLANNAVKEIEAVNGSIPVSPTIKTLGSGFNSPVGIAVDASGNVYVADLANNAVKEIEAVNGSIPASPTIITLGSGFDQPGGVVVDGSRNVFIADTLNNRLVKLDFADPPSLIFASTVVGSTSTDSPKTITIENAGNAALTFPIPSTGNNPTIAANFTLNSIGSSDCPLLNNESLEPATLAAGASCQLPISFAPTAAGTFSGSLALTDTNLNAAAPGYALQSILLSGTGVNNFTLGASPSALSVLQSGSVTTSITVTGVNGPAGSVNLAASGLPSGVTASFSPNPTTGTSVLTLTASSTAAAGTYNVSITGTSATLTATATLALTVNTPNFGISSSVGSAGMVPDSSLTSTITVTPKNGFTGSVSLVASGLPSGVTASFTPNPTTGTSILTLTASDTAASGDTILTITGTSGAQTATTHIEIGFPYFPPSFYLVPWNAYSTIPQGGIGTTTITVTDQNGFTGDVSLALSGLPSGVTASFGMNPTTGTSVLTLAVSDTAATGFHALTVTGASGTLSATANIYLTITPAAGFSPPSGSFGAINVGTSGPTQTLTYTFGANVILGSISVLTQGATGLDFANAGTGTCIANPVNTNTVGETCTVNVTFTPQFAGTRNGAVVLYDNNGNAIATAYLQGSGVGPQVNFFPGTQTTLGSGFDFASGVAVDGSGNLYVVDTIGNLGNVQEIMAVNGSIPANPTIKTLVGGLDCPGGPALDAAGNVYFFDVCYHTVNEIQAVNGGIPASPTVRTLTSQFASPAGITVDGSGNVYILDASNNTVNEILAVNGSIPTSPTITTLASGFKELNGIAVDGSGNVYVSDDISRQVFEIQAINGSIPAPPVITPLGSGFVIPRGIAVDVAGNVYVAEYFYNTVYEILAENGSIPASPTIQTLGTGLVYANGVAVDGNRNVFVADYGDGRVVKLDYADPPSLTFATTAVGSTSTDSPQTVTIENVGNAALSFPIPSTGNNPNIAANFTLNSNGATACPLVSAGSTTAGTLAAGASCQLPISFSPTEAGALSAALVLTDNNLNAAAPGYTMHSITLSGTSTRATPSITWPTPVPITYGTALSATQLNASSTVAGTFTYSPVAGTVLTAGAQTLTVTFTPTDTADYTTATATVTLTVTQATPIVAWPTPAAVTYGTPLGGTQLNANSTVGGSFTYSPIAGTVLAAGAQTLIATFTPTDTADYTTATATVTLTVNQATPSITWPTPAPITYGTALSATQLNASSTVAGTFTY
ncbi:MAG TPA: choice-of-anchor D domain-containing protein, partial [Terracidiphilus sp.]